MYPSVLHTTISETFMPNVTIAIDSDLLMRAKAEAKANCRSLSQQVAFWIMRENLAAKPKPKGGNFRKGGTI